ncbi:MAG: transglutaminase family protein [Elainellaceae cyanobacterium]
MKPYLKATSIVDWTHPAVLAQAKQLAANASDPEAVAKACFEWVRDEIRHSCDHQLSPTTCRASDVLARKSGYCYAKSHLLAALLRANGVPAGFCYQRLSVNDDGSPYCLHGLNAVHLPKLGWYRIDPRGNKPGVNAQFTPPQEQLAFNLQLPEEADFRAVLPEPLPVVVAALQQYHTWDEVLYHLPDIGPESAEALRLEFAP